MFITRLPLFGNIVDKLDWLPAVNSQVEPPTDLVAACCEIRTGLTGLVTEWQGLRLKSA
jgi:hypothetical protein